MAPSLALIPMGLVLVGCLATSVLANQLSSDCMKNPFASGCRGISAKRSTDWPLVRPLGGHSFELLSEPGQQQEQQRLRMILANRFSRANPQDRPSSLQEQSGWPLQPLATSQLMQSLGATEMLIQAAMRILEEQQTVAGASASATQASDGRQRLIGLPSIASANGQATLRSGDFAPGGE